jgi:proton glutamate symport protein
LKLLKSLKLSTWIFLALFIGLAIGVFWPEAAHYIKPFRTVFLNGVKCIIAPLIFASIVCGIASAGSVKNLGKIGLIATIWFEVATTAALAIGLIFVNWLRPGDGLSIGHEVSKDILASANQEMSFTKFIEHLFPQNIADAVARGDVLQIVIFSIIFGIAVLLAGEKGKSVLNFCQSLNDVMFHFTSLIMTLAPIGVGAAMASSIAEHGLGVMIPMAKMVGTLYLALIAFVLIVLCPALFYAKVKILAFIKEFKPAIVLAFATTSSESAYPQALRSLNKMGVSPRISSFVLPLGYSFNLDGSTLYLAIASVFIAQAANIELSLTTQITMMLTLMLTTKGVAAVPRASMVVLSATLTAFGLPLEGIVLIIGVDEFMDMARTAVNLLGNSVATLVVARWEEEELTNDFRA